MDGLGETYWKWMFVMQIFLSVAVIVELYGTIYFWISLAFFMLYYAIACIVSCTMWIYITREDWSNPLLSYLMPCVFITRTESYCDCVSGRKCWYSCILCSFLPILVYMLFLPVYITLFLFC